MTRGKANNRNTVSTRDKMRDNLHPLDELTDSARARGAGRSSVDKNLKGEREKYICGHCSLECSEEGKGSEAFCCEFCGGWVHAACEGIDKEAYRKFSELCDVIPNMSYYCSLNQCKKVSEGILKKIGPITEQVDSNTKRIGKLEEEVMKQNSEL